MRIIKLTHGKFAIVDDEDYEWLSKFTWYAYPSRQTWYAGSPQGSMHRLVLPDVQEVDHINRHGLDNRKRNLRSATRQQNTMNSRPKQGKKYKGVTICGATGKYLVRIMKDGRSFYIGRFRTERAAAKAYDKKAKELFGVFAYLNFP